MNDAPLGSALPGRQPEGERSLSVARRVFDFKVWAPGFVGAATAEVSIWVYFFVGTLGFYAVDWRSPLLVSILGALLGLGVGLFVGWTRRYHPRAAGRVFTWKAWSSVILGTLATYWSLVFLIGLGRLGLYRLSFAESQVPPLLHGFEVSLEVVAVIIPLGFGVGFLVGWARTSRSLVLRGFAAYYVDFFRSMPPIALIFFASLFAALALKDTTVDPFLVHDITLWAGVVALGLHTAAYQAEIVRAGILSVPAGQTEAADSVGVSRLRSMFLVVLPQAFRISLPALGNEFSSVIKDTSLLSIIGWFELSGVAQAQASLALNVYLRGSLVIWFETAMLYFVLTYVVTRTVRVIEDLFKVPGLEVARL